MSALTSLLDNFSSHLRTDKFISKTFNLPPSQQLDQFHKNFGQFLITGDFIDEYNEVKRGVQKSKFDFLMHNLINLLKRYVSLDEKSKSAEVKRIPLIWSNLCGVMLCRGNLQEEALETLIFSLQTSNFYPTHAPILIYIICTVLYLIHTDSILQTKLERFEVGLYYLGYLVCKRLLVHLYLGEIDQSEAEAKLSVYLRGFASSHIFYKNLPTIEWYHNFISASCNHIIKYNPESRTAPMLRPSQTDLSMNMNMMILKMFSKRKSKESELLSWCLVQALQVWRNCRYNMSGCEVHVETLLKFCRQLKFDNWIDLILSLDIIGEAAKENMYILVVLQMLARGSEELKGIVAWPQKVALRYVHVLADICRNTSKSAVRKQALQGGFPIKNHPFDVHGDKPEVFKSKVYTRCTSLMSLAFLRFERSASKEKHEVAWKLRHASYIHLVQLLKSRGDGSLSFDYMRTLCWALLQQVKYREDDERVFDAHSIAEMGVFYDQAVSRTIVGTIISDDLDTPEKEGERLNSYVAQLLATRYLPSLSMSSTDSSKRPMRRSTLKSLMSMNIVVRRPLKPNERKRLSSKGIKYEPGTAIIDTEQIFGQDSEDEVSTAPPEHFPIEFQKNHILMYTSVTDISNKLFLLISGQIMRDTMEEWESEIGQDKGFPDRLDESVLSR